MFGSLIESYRSVFRGLSREVWTLSFVLLVNRSGTMVLPFLTLYLTTQMGYSASEAGVFLALYGVGAVGGSALGGRLTDAIGHKPVQLVSLVGTGVLFIVLGAVGSAPAFGATVLVLGLFAESFRPASSAAIAAYTQPHERSRAFGLQRLAVNVGWTIGPAFGGFLALIDYQLLFWVDAATCLAAALFLALALPHGSGRADKQEAEEAPPRSPWTDGAYVFFLALLLLQALIFFQLMSTFPLFLRNERGFTEALIGLTVAMNTVLIVLFEMQLIRAVRRFAPLKVVGVAGLLTGLGFGLLPYSWSLIAVLGTVVVWTFGEMLSFPLTAAWAANRAGARNRGRYMGAQAMVFSVGVVVAPLAGTATYERLGPDVLWHACLVLGALNLAGYLWLARRLQASGSTDPTPVS